MLTCSVFEPSLIKAWTGQEVSVWVIKGVVGGASKGPAAGTLSERPPVIQQTHWPHGCVLTLVGFT